MCQCIGQRWPEVLHSRHGVHVKLMLNHGHAVTQASNNVGMLAAQYRCLRIDQLTDNNVVYGTRGTSCHIASSHEVSRESVLVLHDS